MTEHTCMDAPVCDACEAEFLDSPAGILSKAIDAMSPIDANCPVQPPRVADELAGLLQVISDDMSDEHAVEKEYPEHIPSMRWQVVDWYGQGKPDREDWNCALATARAILGEPDPNATDTEE